MLFGEINVGGEFNYFGQRLRKVKKRKIRMGGGFTHQNMESVDQTNGYVPGYLADDQEVEGVVE